MHTIIMIRDADVCLPLPLRTWANLSKQIGQQNLTNARVRLIDENRAHCYLHVYNY